ncbi:MAG: ATP synthase F0 subunit C [Nesterenkonia sp.]|uniref:ATP synthase subunit c n=1 Tax=Nesterenkonia aerolata TaxID=3074079 RepID=A0ABU2DSN6_9MICC|nr:MULTISPECIES: ATP synthase F0 subunit C [unclassified Nesterenkonia]MDO5493786.1 ATP synthase F0 subunit C [Nesterenkonia sp.]MDR8019516.1 ATP synthase F0 subunit C [Nesterenkonia sp. LY-0111]
MVGSLNLIGLGVAGLGSAIAIGLIFAAYINGVARQPEAQRVLQPIAILGFALAEAVFILAIVFAFVIN